MKPTVGRIVRYRLQERETKPWGPVDSVIQGPQNAVAELPAMIVNVWSDTMVNLKVFNDGSFDFWKTSVSLGDGPGNWYWPDIPKAIPETQQAA